MLKQLQLHADVCRTNASLATKCGNTMEAQRWKQAALEIEHAIRTIRTAATCPSGG